MNMLSGLTGGLMRVFGGIDGGIQSIIPKFKNHPEVSQTLLNDYESKEKDEIPRVKTIGGLDVGKGHLEDILIGPHRTFDPDFGGFDM